MHIYSMRITLLFGSRVLDMKGEPKSNVWRMRMISTEGGTKLNQITALSRATFELLYVFVMLRARGI